MGLYRFFLRGNVGAGHNMYQRFGKDAEALDKAKELSTDYAVEVWSDERLIGYAPRLEATSKR